MVCSRGAFSGPPATLWEPSGERQGFPAPMHSQLLSDSKLREGPVQALGPQLCSPRANKRLVKGMALHRKK